MGEEIKLDIPFRKDESEVNGKEIYFSSFGSIMSGSSDAENYQQNFLSIERPLKATEVFSKLRRKGWGKFDGRFMTESDKVSSQRLMYRVYIPCKSGNQVSEIDYPEDVIDVIDTGYGSISDIKEGENGEKIVESEVRISPFFQMWPEKFNSNPNYNDTDRKAIKNQVDALYKEVFGEDLSGVNAISFRRTTKDVISAIDRSVSFDLISSDSDLYTNCIDLSELRGYAVVSDISARIDVTVQYSTYEENLPDESKRLKVFNRDITFSAFRYEYDKDSNIVECISESFRNEMNHDVIISYSSETGILEVTPLSKRVSECIISRCAVTYGKF